MSLQNKYRPRTLDEIIGHDVAVARARGMLKRGDIQEGNRNAILLTGPSSAGKTTFGRVIASALMGVEFGDQGKHRDFTEVDGTSNRKVEDLEKILRVAALNPQQGKYRTILVDEAQRIIENKDAAPKLLKPLEEPHKKLLWILCSMEPDRFKTGNGLAIANRCTHFQLSAPTREHLFKFGARIARGEKMGFLDKDSLTKLVSVCESFRDVANALEATADYAAGSDLKKGQKIPVEEIASIITGVSEADSDALVIQFLTGVYAKSIKPAYRALMDVDDGQQFLNKLMWANKFMLYLQVCEGRHAKIWWTPLNKALLAAAKKNPPNLGVLAAVDAMLSDVKSRGFAMDPTELLGAGAYRVVLETAKH